jgi:hypothetical protein
VKRISLADYSPRLRKPEAIFIWNCFEQLEEPGDVLRRAYQLLDRHGLLVVRVPNGDFYRRMRGWKPALRTLGYNNLLGFPYLHGYSPASLELLLRSYSFLPMASYDTGLLTPPYPDFSRRIRCEWASASTQGGWIELVAQKRNR